MKNFFLIKINFTYSLETSVFKVLKLYMKLTALLIAFFCINVVERKKYPIYLLLICYVTYQTLIDC